MNKILLHKELFPAEVIVSCIGDYGRLADIRMRDAGAYWELTFRNCRLDVERTRMEFENYLIANTYRTEHHGSN